MLPGSRTGAMAARPNSSAKKRGGEYARLESDEPPVSPIDLTLGVHRELVETQHSISEMERELSQMRQEVMQQQDAVAAAAASHTPAAAPARGAGRRRASEPGTGRVATTKPVSAPEPEPEPEPEPALGPDSDPERESEPEPEQWQKSHLWLQPAAAGGGRYTPTNDEPSIRSPWPVASAVLFAQHKSEHSEEYRQEAKELREAQRRAQRDPPKKAQHVHDVHSYSPRWQERRRHPKQEELQRAEIEKAKEKAAKETKEAEDTARQNTGPLTETVSADQTLRYGQIFFEETGNTVPYIIAPEGVKESVARQKAAERLLAAMVKTMKRGGERLTKPNIIFKLLGHGTHYLEWAREVYENDVLAQAWSWDTEEEKKVYAATKIQSCARGRRSRQVYKYVHQISTAALMGLVIESRLNHESGSGEGHSTNGPPGEKDMLRNMVNAADGNAKTQRGARRPHIGPLRARVSMFEWKLNSEGVELKHTAATGGPGSDWQRGTVKQAVSALKSSSAKQKRVAFRWYVDGRPDPMCDRAKFPTTQEALVWLEYQGHTLSTLKEHARDELDIDTGLIEYYTSTTPAFFRAVMEDRPYILKALIETQWRDPKSATTMSAKTLSLRQCEEAKKLTMFQCSDAPPQTLQQFSQNRCGNQERDMGDEKEAMPKNRAHAVLQGEKMPDYLQVAKGSKNDDAAEADKEKPNFTTETLLSRALRLGCNLDAALDRRQEKHIQLLRQLHELIDKHRETDASAHERHNCLSELYESLAQALEVHERCLAQRQPSVDTTEQVLRSFKPDQIFEYWTTIDGWASEGHSPIARRQTAELHAVIEQLAVYEDVYTNKHLTQNDLIDAIVEQSRGAIERRTRRRKSRLQNIDLRATKSALANAAVRTRTFQKLRDQLDAVNAHIEKELANPGNLNESDTRTSTASIALILKELLSFQNADTTQTKKVGRAVVQAVESDRAQTNDGDDTEDSILMRAIRTSLASAGSEDESAESGDPSSETDRLANLVSIERWEVTFRDRLRDEPTLGARLGLPLDLDNSAFTRLVTDIARHVQLPGEFCCPIALIEERIEELREKEESRDTWRTTLDESRKMKLEEDDMKYLDENGIGLKFWGRIAEPPPAQEGSPRASDEEDPLKVLNGQFQKEWGGKSVGAYLQWMRDSTIDLEKVRTYFLCDHSKGACRTVEEELRSELKQLPFTPYEDRGPDEPSRNFHLGHFPMHPGRQRDIPLDRAMIEFGDRMVSVYSNLAQGVVNSEGWLFFPAGRGPQHQLIGETVAR
eukprot:COSAG06_NODE_2861_length_6161_cov_22.755856_3_plen_1273_part_01